MNEKTVETGNSEEYMIWLIEDKIQGIKKLENRIQAIMLVNFIALSLSISFAIGFMFFPYNLIYITALAALAIAILVLYILTFTKKQLKLEIDLTRESMISPSFRKKFKANLENYFFEINENYNWKKRTAKTVVILFSIEASLLILMVLTMVIMLFSMGILGYNYFF